VARKTRALTLLYSRRVENSLDGQLLFAETLGWALRTLAEDAQAAAGAPEPAHPRILALLREFETDPVARPSVSELAARAHMGLTAFREAFHRAPAAVRALTWRSAASSVRRASD